MRIQNKDDLCFARIIVTAKAKKDHHEQRNITHLGKPLQEEMERHLHQQNMSLVKEGIQEIKKVSMRVTWLTTSRHIKRSFQWDHLQRHGSGIYLHFHDDHFDVITSMTAFLQKLFVFAQNARKNMIIQQITNATTYAMLDVKVMNHLKVTEFLVRPAIDSLEIKNALIFIRGPWSIGTRHVKQVWSDLLWQM